MSTNLVSLVSSVLTPDLIARIASALGLDPAMVNKAVSAAVPALLGSLAGAATKADGAGRLFDAVTSQKPDLLGGLAGAIGGAGQKALVDGGLRALGGILGGQSSVDGLAGAIGKFAGLPQGQSTSLVGMLAPAVLGVLGSQAKSGGLDGGGLANLLASQSSDIMKAMPAGLSDVLAGSGLLGGLQSAVGSATGAAGAAAQSAARSAQSAAGSAAQSAGSAAAAANRAAAAAAQTKASGLPSWAPWAIGLIAVLLIGWWLFGGRTDQAVQEAATTAEQAADAASGAAQQAADAAKSAADTATTAAEQATDAASTAVQQATDAASTAVEQVVAALPDLTVGGVDVAATANAAFASLKQSLASVKDVESAKAALPTLEDASTKLGSIEGVLGQIPAAGRSALVDALTKYRPQIDAAFDQALAIPGVAEVVKPAIDQIRAKLDAIAKPA
jgi:hypothetical protein